MEELQRQGYSGGEELRRAMAALAGSSGSKEDSKKSVTGPAPQPVPLPVQLAETTEPAIRELAYAAQKYGRAAQHDTNDFEAVYNYGLALQELALRATNSRQEQQQLLLQAAAKYERAWELKQTSHAALYNWGVALSDLARVVKGSDKEQAHQYLVEAARKYSMSLHWNPNNPQALNNWGLVLQELSTIRAPAEQSSLVKQSISRFRRAIRLRPDFDRACYNLGTVYYSLACAQQASLTQRLPSRVTQDPEHEEAEKSGTAAAQQSFTLAAQYILLAHALQPGKEVYRKSLHLIQPLLPIPHLRSGVLQAPVPETAHTCSERWRGYRFVLDEQSFRSCDVATSRVSSDDPEGDLGPSTSGSDHSVHLEDISAAKPCVDPSLPSGHAFWLGLVSQPCGVYFVADNAEDAEGWVDALQLCAHIASLKQATALQSALRNPATKFSSPQAARRTEKTG